ncbi:zinc dependent phospholipase C family protein [Candidatus Woesearchaeota archaeon]|nr:zinc dependent phospholipase C family protein [Candidatus Woesearchaeota archaeon]
MLKYMLLIILLSASVSAWGWQGHPAIAQELVYTIDTGYNLDFDSLGNGSIAPDRDFHDNVRHHYPPSLNLTLDWLNKTRYYLEIKDYKQASYAFGVVSHYITDSFAAPHYIKKEPYKLHTEYEHQIQGNYLKAECKKDSFNLYEELSKGPAEGPTWSTWLKTKDPEIPKLSFQKASKLVYLIALDTFNADCVNKKTNYEKIGFFTMKNILAAIIIGILIIFLIISILKEN